MRKERIQRIHRIYSIATGILCIISGLCLIAGCLNIYNSGLDQPYSRDIVAQTFAEIAVPIYLCIALIFGGFVLDLMIPNQPRKDKPAKDYVHILSQLKNKADMDNCDTAVYRQIRILHSRRKIHRCILAAIISVCSILFLSYCLNIRNFDKTLINESMIRAMYVLIPCVIASFGYGVFVSFYTARSIQKEISLFRQIPAAKGSAPPAVQRCIYQKYLQCAITAAAVALILYGLFKGGTLDVLTKAVNICTECIGLG